MLNRFARWFASSGGVWQTAGLVGLVVVLEYTHVIHDTSMFQLMAWLTIYSGVTQPVLAYANRQDTSQGDLILARIEEISARIEAKEDQEIAILSSNGHIAATVAKDAG